MHAVNKKLLFITIILASMTTLLAYIYMSRQEKVVQKVEDSSVVVAVKSIDKGAIISSDNLKVIKVAKETANAKAYSSITEITGKRAKEKIIEGEQVLKDRILDDEKSQMSYSIPEGKRAVTVNVNEASEVADFIRPGDFVDIIVTFDKYELEDGKSKIVYPRITRTILQNILVLGMGQLQEITEKGRQGLPKTVTLAATPDEAEKLVYGTETGVMRMALRRVGEHDPAATQGVIRDDLATDKGKIVLPK